MYNGLIRAKEFYDSLDMVDGIFDDILAILRKPNPSADDMKKAEQFKNTARGKIAEYNARANILAGWDSITYAFEKMEGTTPAGKARKPA